MHKQILQKPDASHDWMDVCYTHSGPHGNIESLIFRVRPKVIGAYAELVAAYADSMPTSTRSLDGGTLTESLRVQAVETYREWVEDELYYENQRKEELQHQFEMLAERDFSY